MTGSDVPNVDMPNIPRPQRQDEPAVTDADLAALLAGTADAAPGLRPVADVLAALTAEPTGIELAGELLVGHGTVRTPRMKLACPGTPQM